MRMQQVKYLVLSLQWLGLLLWYWFNPWSMNFHTQRYSPKKKKKNKQKNKQKKPLEGA